MNELQILMDFHPDDLQALQTSGALPPNFWPEWRALPVVGDWIRFGDRQYSVIGRIWEYNERGPLLVIGMGKSDMRTDAHFH